MGLLDTSLLRDRDFAGAGPAPAVGSLSILNVGAGDLRFRFDQNEPAEVEAAKRVIEDLLKRGYTILVRVGDELQKVSSFDPECECYLVSEVPAESAAEAPIRGPRRRGRPPKAKVPMRAAEATALAPTAGG